MVEFEGPSIFIEDLPKIDINDKFSWAKAPVLREPWIRRCASTFGVDEHMYLLGEGLGSIVGDDANSFGIHAAGFLPQIADQYAQNILTRLNWEIALLELPDFIRMRLSEVEEALRGTKLHTEQGFYAGRELWEKRARDFTIKQLIQYPELKNAEEYRLQNGKEMQAFIERHFFRK